MFHCTMERHVAKVLLCYNISASAYNAASIKMHRGCGYLCNGSGPVRLGSSHEPCLQLVSSSSLDFVETKGGTV